jgi:hypothetical protein
VSLSSLLPIVLHPTDFMQLKEEYRIVKALCEQSGSEWDEQEQLVTAPDDIWEKYIKVCTLLCACSY